MEEDSDGALSESDLNFVAPPVPNHHQNQQQSMLNNERQHIIAQLGDFSMSGMTSSNIGGSIIGGSMIDKSQIKQEINKNVSQEQEDGGIEELSEISSAMKTNNNEKQEDDDPNSLENRLKSIRM